MKPELSSIINVASERAQSKQLGYQGEVLPKEAYTMAQLSPKVKIVDVRTHAELELVGHVPGAIHIEWASYPGMQLNPNFLKELGQAVSKNDILIFMCRTGGRSHHAATLATEHGFSNAYNMLEGFEGASNDRRQRCMVNGWRFADLPWTNY